MKALRLGVILTIVILFILIMFQSCYSVRMRTVNGVGTPDPVSDRMDYYRDLKVIEKDTVITIGAVDKDFTYLIKDCPSGGLQTVEYRSTLWGVILSGITFGRKRQMKIKYVCTKPAN